MAVFTAAILDSFTRANASSGAAGALDAAHGWLNSILCDPNPDFTLGVQACAITSNHATGENPNGKSSSTWGTQMLDCEVSCIVGSTGADGSEGLYARVQNPGNAGTFAGYQLLLSTSPGLPGPGSSFTILSWTGGSTRTLLASGTPGGAFTSSDQIGLRCYSYLGGVMLEGWVKTVAAGVWVRRIRALDFSILVTGYPGVMAAKTSTGGGTCFVDDFAAGTITAPATTITADDTPGFTGTVVIEDDIEGADADAGPFRAVTAQGVLPVPSHPEQADYPIFPGVGTSVPDTDDATAPSVF